MRARASVGVLVAAGLASAFAAPDARACGGCFAPPPPPSQVATVITDHRMIFRVTPQATTLYDEIEYQGDPAEFAWVLPIQGPVTVGLSSDALFSALDDATQTTIVAPPLPTCPSCACADNGGAAFGGGSGTGSSSSGAVNVISQEVVGPYETVQLQSTDPNALTNWLTMRGYDIPADVASIIATYVTEGFDFLALRLVPGMGVSTMRPVRVTTPGAGLTLPLRMVAAGTGATVGITLWVIGDGRYEPANFESFTIDPSTITWDFAAGISNYATLRSSEESALQNKAWQIESSTDVSPYTVEQPLLNDVAGNDYLPIPSSAGADGGAEAGGGETAEQVRQDDLAVLFPGSQGTVRVTRMRADLSHAALANDLALTASTDDATLSNVYQVTQYVNAPACPSLSSCPPCDIGGSGTSSGYSSSNGSGPSGSGGGGSGCATAGSDAHGGFVDLGVAAFAGLAFLGMRGRGRR